MESNFIDWKKIHIFPRTLVWGKLFIFLPKNFRSREMIQGIYFLDLNTNSNSSVWGIIHFFLCNKENKFLNNRIILFKN